MLLMLAITSYANAGAVNGCDMRAGTQCVEMNLKDTQRKGADLARSDFSRSNL